jgi:DNA-binding response OmpR family regulator
MKSKDAASRKPVILVVEDDDQTALFIRYVLERDGYEVEHAADGRQAEALIARLSPPALVTLDVDLPDTTGDELMLRIKTAPGWGRVPVVMVTVKPKSLDVTWAVKTGAKGYLVKPFRPEELLDCVRKLTAPKAGA